MFLDIIHRPDFINETPSFLYYKTQLFVDCLQVKRPQLGPIDRASPYLRTLVFLMLEPYEEFRVSSDDFYLDSFLVQSSIRVEFFEYFNVLS
jgi:hypothetical protein